MEEEEGDKGVMAGKMEVGAGWLSGWAVWKLGSERGSAGGATREGSGGRGKCVRAVGGKEPADVPRAMGGLGR